MKRVAGVVVAIAVALAVAGFVWLQGVGTASGQPPEGSKPQALQAVVNVKVPTSTKTDTVMAGGLKRSYEVIAPVKALPKSAPIIVFLSGIGATPSSEASRDDLIPYATSDQAELVYPAGYDKSWNAIGCCGEAAAKNVNDLAFMDALVAAVNPGHARPIYLVGFSNGGRLAYRIICTDPGLFDEYAVVKAGPPSGCTVHTPVSILQIASVDDPEVPYKPGDHGLANEPLPMTTLVTDLQETEQCPADDTVQHSGEMTLTTWSGCADGTRLAFGVWSVGVHAFPRPPASVPAASQVIWSFFTRTALAPLPK